MASLIDKLARFAGKSPQEQFSSLGATCRSMIGLHGAGLRRLFRLLRGVHAPPGVLRGKERLYLAYRPESEVMFGQHPEAAELSARWIDGNLQNNAGDLPRLYALMFNIKQVLSENIPGDMAELGVYRGNSAAVLAHYARESGRTLMLFDTFEGFDRRDLVGMDRKRLAAFGDTSVEWVRALVGDSGVRFVQGRFPQSIPPGLESSRFCMVHIDCDLYEPAKAGLAFFYPLLSPGGLLILHDYANPCWPGIKRAVDEYCRGIPERPILFGDKSGTAMIRKCAGGRGQP